MPADISEAFRRAAQHFYDGNDFQATAKAAGKPVHYNNAFFDGQEKSLRKKMAASDKKASRGDLNA